MRRGTWLICGIGCLPAVGCFLAEDQTPESFFRTPVPVSQLPPLTPAATEAAVRVDVIGRKILAANTQIGAKPMFRTIGAPQPEIFHRGTSDVFITEGLVRQCATDAQLAAILSSELGKVVAERELKTPAQTRRPDRPPPLDVRLGNDELTGGSPDQTRLAELAQLEGKRKPVPKAGLPPPDARSLAIDYLTKAGYKPEELTAVEPLLRAAATNTTLEKQIAAPITAVQN